MIDEAQFIVGMQVDPMGYWLAGLISAVMFSSAFTGFCPVRVLGLLNSCVGTFAPVATRNFLQKRGTD